MTPREMLARLVFLNPHVVTDIRGQALEAPVLGPRGDGDELLIETAHVVPQGHHRPVRGEMLVVARSGGSATLRASREGRQSEETEKE